MTSAQPKSSPSPPPPPSAAGCLQGSAPRGMCAGPGATMLHREGCGSGAWGSGQLLPAPAQSTLSRDKQDSGWPWLHCCHLLPASRAQERSQAMRDTSSSLTSVCFAGVDSLEVFIFFWGWEVFDRMKGVFGFKVICREGGKMSRSGRVALGEHS